jgi:hypothetical protein
MKSQTKLSFPGQFYPKDKAYSTVYFDSFTEINVMVESVKKNYLDPVCVMKIDDHELSILIAEKVDFKIQSSVASRFLDIDDDKAIEEYIRKNLNDIKETIYYIEQKEKEAKIIPEPKK